MSERKNNKKHGGVASKRSRDLRRLFVATGVFALAVATVLWLVYSIVMKDLSDTALRELFNQTQEETESFVKMLETTSTGDADMLSELRAEPGGAIDPDALLRLDEKGRPVAIGRGKTIADDARAALELGAQVPGRPLGDNMVANLQQHGRETQWLINGELMKRDAIEWVKIDYDGGTRTHLIRTIDTRDFNASALESEDYTATRVVWKKHPTSRPIVVEWDSFMGDGKPMHLSAMVDTGLVHDKIAAIQERVVPKLMAVGLMLVLLYVLGYTHVVKLLDRNRRFEIAAKENQRLSEVGILAAGLAHEIRNPLSAVRMNLQLLDEDLADSSEQKAADFDEERGILSSVQGELGRLAGLVTDFLAYARPAEPRKRMRSLDDVVAECVELFRPTATEAGVELELVPSIGASEMPIDDAVIKQALTNILLNAIEAVEQPGGRVRVSTRCEGEACQVTVSDDGPGLAEGEEVAFQVFHSTKKGGFGLGLAISRSRVERHGGTLRAGVAEEGGAAFTISLPRDATA